MASTAAAAPGGSRRTPPGSSLHRRGSTDALAKTVVVGVAVGVVILTGFWASSSGGGEVSGSVLVGQEPLGRAEVVLVPDRGESEQCKATRTVTDRDGRFRFAVGKGEGQVARAATASSCSTRRPSGPLGKPGCVPADYRAPQQTPLRLDVGESSVVFDILIAPDIRPRPAHPGRSLDDLEYQFRSVVLSLHRREPGRVE